MQTVKEAQNKDPFFQELRKTTLAEPFAEHQGIWHGEPPVIVLPKGLQEAALKVLYNHPTSDSSVRTRLSESKTNLLVAKHE
jgi:hypothetical protein